MAWRPGNATARAATAWSDDVAFPSAESLLRTLPNAAPGVSEAGGLWSDPCAADFDADGYADLVVGPPHEGLGAAAWVGEVTILRDYANGLPPSCVHH